MGVPPGTKLALLVPQGIDLVSLVFGFYKAGVVAVLIDPGMGRRNMIRCLAEAEPEGFVAIPVAQAIRSLLPRLFPRRRTRFNVTVGKRWFWGGPTLEQLRGGPWTGSEMVPAEADQPAAILFTTGSTGPAKGVLYSHGNFDAQVEQIRDFYGIRPGEVDLPCFPLFGLFNCAMGATAVIPDMDPSHPAQVDPVKIIEAVRDWKVTQAFGSPAIWDRVGRYCESHGVRLDTMRRILSAGAPVPFEVLRRMKGCIHPEGDIHTPYGATESLPVASIAASEVLGIAPQNGNGLVRPGAGVCVGRRFANIQWKVIQIADGPIASIEQAKELPVGEIGELIVRGPQVTRKYVTRCEANERSKIADGNGFWHRIGDSGYLDEEDRFWFCGRVAHRICTADGPLYPIRCEAIFNQHPGIRRSALVGFGPAERQRPVMILEPVSGQVPSGRDREKLLAEIRQLGSVNPLTAGIADFLLHPSFPVDIRHNVKIFREKLAVWAEQMLRGN